MADNLPIEIQLKIFKTLAIKSLIRFRSISKSCKSLIDSPRFISHYTGQQQRLLVTYDLHPVDFKPKYVKHYIGQGEPLIRYDEPVDLNHQYVSVIDDDSDNDSFPKQTVPLTLPPLVNTVNYYRTIGSSHGLLCLLCETGRAVIWNPSIRKVVDVVADDGKKDRTVLGFGVCRETNDPKIVKISYVNWWSMSMCRVDGVDLQVEVFTLSARVWRSLCRSSSSLPRRSVLIDWDQVVINGCLYWLGNDCITLDGTFRCFRLLVSFDLTSEEFGEVKLPDGLTRSERLSMYKCRESLAVVETRLEGGIYHVWMMEDDGLKAFRKVYTITSETLDVSRVFMRGFRKNDEPLIELQAKYGDPRILAAYEPDSESVSDLGINGRLFSVCSYVETLLLL